MPNKYCFAILALVAPGISVAQTDQKDNATAAAAGIGASAPAAATAPASAAKKARAKKALAPANLAASAPASAPAISGASAPAAATATASPGTPATSAGKENTNKPASTTSAAAELPIYKFGGFGTLGISHSSQNQGDYVLDSSMPKGVGRSSNWSLNNNTRLSAHITAKFTPKISAILQVDSEYRSDGSYHPEVEWFNLKYAFTPNIYMRVGRIALSTFMDSENRDVGYSYVWVNPPVDLYHQLSIPSSDGVDAVYRTEIGEAGNTVKAIYGKNTTERPNSVTESRNMWGLFDTFEYGPAVLHLSYQQRMSSTHNAQTGFTSGWTRNSDLSVGASYDPGEWFVISEWIQRRSNTKIGAMYVSGGYRINKFTPYVLYSQNSPGSFYSGSPTITAAAIERANRSQSTTGVGLRWDFMRNYDFKIQYDQVKLSDHSNGYLINVPAGVTLYGSKFHVISAVVDFVF